MSLTVRLLNYLSGRGRGTIWLIALAGVLLMGLIDYVTGTAVSITFFYLLPVSIVSWSLGQRSGQAVAVLCALVMQAATMADPSNQNPAIAFWNVAVRLGVFLVVANLVSEFRRLLKHQTELSRTDPLTGIPNRRAFLEAGELALGAMRRHPSPLTVAFLDIDNFKAVNDAAGHPAGDALLISVAACLKWQLWGSDTVARLGGDEFGLLLPHTDAAAARKVMPRLREQLLHETSAQWPITFSVGVVTCMEPPADIDQLVHRADELMYSAKHTGKDRIEYGMPGGSNATPASKTMPEPS